MLNMIHDIKEFGPRTIAANQSSYSTHEEGQVVAGLTE